jgi:hypothetical protein
MSMILGSLSGASIFGFLYAAIVTWDAIANRKASFEAVRSYGPALREGVQSIAHIEPAADDFSSRRAESEHWMTMATLLVQRGLGRSPNGSV